MEKGNSIVKSALMNFLHWVFCGNKDQKPMLVIYGKNGKHILLHKKQKPYLSF